MEILIRNMQPSMQEFMKIMETTMQGLIRNHDILIQLQFLLKHTLG